MTQENQLLQVLCKVATEPSGSVAGQSECFLVWRISVAEIRAFASPFTQTLPPTFPPRIQFSLSRESEKVEDLGSGWKMESVRWRRGALALE